MAANQTEPKQKTQITMKKGNSVINVDSSRKEYYAKYGYKTAEKKPKSETKQVEAEE